MEYRDLSQEWKEFKQYRRKIEPYAEDLDMIRAISSEPPHFFPWSFWLLPVMLGGALCLPPMLFLWFNLDNFGLLLVFFPLDVGWLALGFIGISLVVLGLSQRGRFMSINPEGVIIPRFLSSSVFIPWKEITRIEMQTNLLNTHVKLIILHETGKTTTDLELFRFPYLRGLSKEFRIIKILQMYIRTQLHSEDPKRVEKRIDRSMKEYRSPKRHISEIIIMIILIAGSWISGRLLGLSMFPQLIILGCMVVISQVIIRRYKSYAFPGLVVASCVLIIILTLLLAPLFPNPLG